MGATLDEQNYVSFCRFKGDCRAAACPRLGERIAEWVQAEPLNLIWDFSGLELIDATSFGAVAGSMVVQIVRGQPVVAIKPPPMVRSYMQACGLGDKCADAETEDDAIVKLIVSLPKRYDSFFFDLLVKEGYVELEQVEKFVNIVGRRDGSDVGLLLLSRQIVSPRDLLACIVKQKSRLGEILVDSGIVSESQLRLIIEQQRQSGRTERLGDILQRLGIATSEDIYEALMEQSKRRRRLKGRIDKNESILLGEILLEDRVVDHDQLDAAVKVQREAGGERRLGDVLLELGYADGSHIYNALLKQYKRKRVSKITDEDTKIRSALDEVVTRLDTEDHMQVGRVRHAILPMGLPGQQALLKALADPSPHIRRNAAWLLGDLGGRRAGGALVDLLRDPDKLVVDAAGWSLLRMSRQLIPYTQLGRWIDWWAGASDQAAREEVPVVSDSVVELEPLLRDMAQNVLVIDDAVIEYQVGLAEWIGGRTNMVLYGSGKVLVTNLFKDEWTFYEGRIAKGQVRELLAELVARKILMITTSRTIAMSKESVHDIAVSVGAKHRCTTFLWYNEIYQNPGFSSFEKRLRAILRDLTHGQVW